MADFLPAFEKTMGFEDSHPSGLITIDNNGARVRFGINEKDNPNMSAAFWDPATPVETARFEAQGEYLTSRWQPNQLGGILNQDVANKLFDMSVNMGRKSIILGQRAAIACGKSLIVDGLSGPHTLDAINSTAPIDYLNELRIFSIAYYHAVEGKNPADIAYDSSWMTRARA